MLAAMILAQTAAAPDFAREVRPLLAERCFPCHGPDEATREAELRLDTIEGAHAAFVPGDLDASEAWARIRSEFEFEQMPPPDSHVAPLDEEEQALLRSWIEAGAPWRTHWSFTPPRKAALPDRASHPIDALVARVLEAEGVAAAEPAARPTLARRLSFDLRGLPPTPEEVAAAEDDAALERWIEDMLASTAHAERLAHWWLDAARYADTDGFQQDATRQNWPWRDWVVRAFRENMPLDRFTELQFAGDLIAPDDADAVLATCFHRNHMHNGEGGRDPEESRVDYVRDRVNTVGAVWLGLTLDCAQCHDHKYDPLSQTEYYALSAFFDSIDESGQAGGSAGPFLDYLPDLPAAPLETARTELEASRSWRIRVEEAARGPYLEQRENAADGPRGFLRPRLLGAHSIEGHELEVAEDGVVERRAPRSAQDEYVVRFDPGDLTRVTGIEVTLLPDEGGAFSDAADGHFVLTGVKLARSGQEAPPAGWAGAVADAAGRGEDREIGPAAGALDDDPRKGWTLRESGWEGPARIRLALEEPMGVSAGEALEVTLLFRSNVVGSYAKRARIALTAEKGDAPRTLGPTPREALAEHLEEAGDAPLPDELDARLFRQFLDDDPAWTDADRRVRGLEQHVRDQEQGRGARRVTVLRERTEPRTTAVLERGVWNARGAPVGRAVPASIGAPALATDAPTRLDLARWLTAPDHPLTARVLVNQVWQMLLGRGLVDTPADLGTQCAPPVHEELLDWLAADLVENGWDLRRLVRLIVTSDTYRRTSRSTEAERARDPEGRLLARAPRFRLPSWMIRDAALSASGLLDPTTGGPPVFPHQPPGVWEEMFMGRMRYRPTVGSARHRRSLYAFWRRNVTPTFFFDSADRRTCSVARRMTNTPLQALTLLNDRTFAEAAQALGEGAAGTPGSDSERIQGLARRVLSRELADAELAAVESALERLRSIYERDPAAARAATAPSPLEPVPARSELDHVEVASLTAVAAMLLNTDEAITRE